ncbi:MAG: MBL fold metallo-hydrolase [Oscillospiraceae bacterium]|nr:MBL fold metallo-hydrolase [Oscillospiraceae bacterium]
MGDETNPIGFIGLRKQPDYGGIMQPEEIINNIYCIPVPLPGNPLKEINSYFIRDPECSLLIDTGFRHSACKEALMAGLSMLGAKPGSFDIFLTHVHADHSGLAAEIIGTERKIYISEIDCALMDMLPIPGAHRGEDRWVWKKERDIRSGMPVEMIDDMEKFNPALKFAPLGGAQYTAVKDGAVFNVGGYALKCIQTPGHSPGHICLWDEASGLIFTGDHVLFDITPNITAWPAVEDSLGDYLDSLQLVRKLPVKKALPGHRNPGVFHERIDQLIEHHDRRLAEVWDIVNKHPGLTAYDIAGKMQWKIRAANWNEFPASQKIFAVGEGLAHLNYLRLRGKIRREIDGNVYRFYKENDS